MSSGSKRAWDGVEAESLKRSRDREPRDWRDVHLRSPRAKSPVSRRDSVDKRGGGGYNSRGDYGGRGSEHRVRRDGHSRRGNPYREDLPHHSSAPERVHRSPQELNGRPCPPKDDSEKEEGE